MSKERIERLASYFYPKRKVLSTFTRLSLGNEFGGYYLNKESFIKLMEILFYSEKLGKDLKDLVRK